jgi:drug/metabolite transporter (DMT)-like permease
VQQWPVEPPPTSLLALACAFGACWLLAGNIGTQWGVTHMEAGRAAMIVVLELLIAVVSALWLEGGSLSVGECCGAALLISAALLEARG